MHQITRVSGQLTTAMGLYISVCTCSAAGFVIVSENPLLNPPANSIQQNHTPEIQRQLQNEQNAEQLQQNQLHLNLQQEQEQLQQEKAKARLQENQQQIQNEQLQQQLQSQQMQDRLQDQNAAIR
ncbi:hypothetical protein A4U49_07915 [Acidithiobacillus ferrivorans]|uniref:hypothetical protein n=1 Tax=Acidithiobacillus TaxID=119977 RepID=UPI0008941814|nr:MULTISPECIES: hypothetical protein [Acidithiobacillus]MBU2809589.1 hypothetical protein [Acidithiobacillus ferrooxidans F221]OFA16346.1 hypothetical protein A4U49_07915 [Acidithiobacillus ferrivorans]